MSEEDCDHSWQLKTESEGDGPYSQDYHYWECSKCHESKAASPHDLDDED